MKILFYTDPHLYLTRTAHTTAKSAARLRDALFTSLQGLQGIDADFRVCLGDLFDSYSNPEAGLQQGMQAVQSTDLVMAGNHDLRNSRDTVSSLQLMEQVFPGKVVINAWGEHEPQYLEIGKTQLVFVPHVSTQEEFEQALDEAVNVAMQSLKWKVLCLHCNVRMEGRELSDTTLNLSKERAERLLTTFHSIFVGHEHVPVDMYSQRLRVIGNLHPTGFADISDKRVLLYDTETNESTPITIWKEEDAVWRGPASKIPGPGFGFMDVEDDLPAGEAFKAVSKLFKEDESPYCIRLASKAEIKESDKQATLEEVDKLPDLITRSIAEDHNNLLPLWEELKNAALAKTK